MRCIQLIRMALVFEQARTLKEHKLSRGKLSFVVEELMPTVLEAECVAILCRNFGFRIISPFHIDMIDLYFFKH